MRNLGERVQIVLPEELNTYDVLVNDWLVFSEASLQTVVARLSGEAADDHVVDGVGDEEDDVSADRRDEETDEGDDE
jgi:hypothetical protein